MSIDATDRQTWGGSACTQPFETADVCQSRAKLFMGYRWCSILKILLINPNATMRYNGINTDYFNTTISLFFYRRGLMDDQLPGMIITTMLGLQMAALQ